ncbi:DUF4153 domain-containing protein [Altererythrobacter sp. CC-YST694]|uniref:DUF4153 domain-containing protein n=1 Tax=Altererythrobacter sp. CC-YST694 TaxID=2755038 RepID=UPI001D02946E|nr:DUF4153 domain-containing protein [Altererythrobacter sp. CC-YST694]MCB5426220.1 DUF4153 domain-containing protein [Altererythrobacter sp. CC-YST694]
MEEERIDNTAHHGRDWPLRPWALAVLLGLAGLLLHFVTDGHSDSAPRMAAAAFLFFGPIAAAFSLERDNWRETAIFALLAGLIMAGLAWRAVNAGDHAADEEYGFGAGIIATLLALPLFQAGFHRTRFATPYRDTHFYVWTDAVSAAGALAFTGLSFLLLFVLAELFRLIRIELLHDLLDKGWFGWSVAGIAFGASLGTLRNSLKVLGALQSVVLLVLSLLAVPLAAALVIFLIAVAFSGLDVLWEATRSATPVLLACAAGCFILTNAIVREDDTDMTRNGVMRVTAFVLAMGILPLTLLAVISMGTRVAQYGLSPERLWGLTAIAVACAYGLATWVAAIRGKVRGWRPYVRRANLHLAAGVSVYALLLALPILDFGGISAANQLSRLERGKVSAEDFDYEALKWDFGDAGKRALTKLAKSKDAEVAKLAREAQARKERRWNWMESPVKRDRRFANLRGLDAEPQAKSAFEQLLKRDGWRCNTSCTVLDLGAYSDGDRHFALLEGSDVQHLRLQADGSLLPEAAGLQPPVPTLNEVAAEAHGRVPQVEVRPFSGRQIYVDGKPVGEPFE